MNVRDIVILDFVYILKYKVIPGHLKKADEILIFISLILNAFT